MSQIAYSKIALDNVSWTELKAPVDCYYCVIVNNLGVVLKVRTDQADPNTEIAVQPLMELSLSSSIAKSSVTLKNQVIAYGQLASGAGSVSIRAER